MFPQRIRRMDRFWVLCRTGAMAVTLMGTGLLAEIEEEGEPLGPGGGEDIATRVLTSVAEIFQVPRDTDALSFPVEIEGVVIFTAYDTNSFFLHDGHMGIHINQPKGPRVEVGEQVRAVGVTRRGKYAPSVISRQVHVLGKGVFPEPQSVSPLQIASGTMDSQWLEVEGVVWSVSESEDKRYVILELAKDGGRIRLVVSNPLPLPASLGVDSEVRVRGVATGIFNQHVQMVESLLRVPDISWVTVTRPPPPDPFDQPARHVSRLLEFSRESRPPHRVKVQGVVTRRVSDKSFFIRDAGHGLRVESMSALTLQAGDRIEAAGFPVVSNDEVVIQNALSRKISEDAPPAPVRSDLKTLLQGTYASDLVSVQARLIDWVADGTTINLILQSESRHFKGLLHRPVDSTWAAPEKDSIVDVTGICIINELEERWNYQPRSFLLLLATPDDLQVLKRAPWWTAERLWRAFIITLTLLAAGAAWLWTLRRQVQRKRSVIEHQASHAAVLEERSRIARDLHDTLEQGLTGLSLQFKAIETDLRATPHPAGSRLALARHMLRQSRALARNAIRELRDESIPAPRENLVQALRNAAEMWNHSGALTIAMHVTGDPGPLPGTIEHNLIGIGTEAMTNAVKHGRATAVQVEIGFSGRLIRLRIQDNGAGFDASTIPTTAQGSFGLVGMRERAAEMGARIEIQSKPGQGTAIIVEMPLASDALPVRTGPRANPAPAEPVADFP